MRIISIRKKDDENVVIKFDDSQQLIISVDTLFKSGLKKDDEISEDRFAFLIESNISYYIKKKALSFLARRAHTEKELFLKLKAKSYDEGLIKSVIKELRNLSFIDDREFAVQFVNEKSFRNKWGRLKIKSALISRGINHKIIDQVLSASRLKELESQQINELAVKKYSILKKRETDEKKIFQKLISFLLSKGYDYDSASNTVKKIIKADIIDS
ncbi:MAG: regulatory protein RecX [Ignavibacterium sp.]|jgi:regulatory protein|nr:regulatory protein RecX [Ignavibacterium sp.]